MQTFLPYEDFTQAAASLDYMRLGKQRVETLQVLQTLLGFRLVSSYKDAGGKKVALPKESWTLEVNGQKGWRNHPAVKMWRGSELALLSYQDAVCDEWTSRGYSDSCKEKSHFLLEPFKDSLGFSLPSWLGDEELHASHRSNLLRKDPVFYGAIWPNEPADLPYIWPVQ